MSKKEKVLTPMQNYDLSIDSIVGQADILSQKEPLESANTNVLRNHQGLFISVPHVFNEDTTVNWRAMIPSQYIVFNKQREEDIKKTYGDELKNLNPSECDPKFQLILLAGFKYIARIRGFSKVKYSRPAYGNDAVSVTCEITWKPNFETEGSPVVYADVGGASTNNTSPIGKNKLGQYAYYLETIAANRAFVRAVRNFLNIPTLGFDEIGSSLSEETPSQTSVLLLPHEGLEKKCVSKGIKLEFLIKKAISDKWELEKDPSTWTTWKDIGPRDSYALLSIISKDSGSGIV